MHKGDKEAALKVVLEGDSVERSRELARWHAQVRSGWVSGAPWAPGD